MKIDVVRQRLRLFILGIHFTRFDKSVNPLDPMGDTRGFNLFIGLPFIGIRFSNMIHCKK